MQKSMQQQGTFRVKKIIRHSLESISPKNTLNEAADVMKTKGIGSLPVIENGHALGFLTDRDIVIRSVAQGKDPKQIKVSDVMSQEVISCRADCTLDEAAKIMRDHQVRRLVVTDEQDNPMGIISLADLAALDYQNEAVHEAIQTLKANEH